MVVAMMLLICKIHTIVVRSVVMVFSGVAEQKTELQEAHMSVWCAFCAKRDIEPFIPMNERKALGKGGYTNEKCIPIHTYFAVACV